MAQIPSSGPSKDTLGEFAQAKVRCWMNLALITLAVIAYHRDPTLSLRTVWYTFLFTALSAVGLLAWARAVSQLPAPSRARAAQRIASIVLDNVAISWILYFGGEALAGVFSVYLWISIGYGMRFGLRYLFANLAASILGFSVIATLSSFWREYPFLSFGLGVGLVVTALYTAFLITQLHTAVSRAESASRAKSDFVAKMSHELRTPLHGIIALAELLGGTHSSAQKHEMLRQISVSSNTLLNLINRILDISKYESAAFTLPIEPMNLHEVIDDVISILKPQAYAKGIDLSVFIDAAVENHVLGAPLQIQEILVNLAGNALKFTEHGSVRISVLSKGEDQERSLVGINVQDTGPGIPPEYLSRIFEPFTQADDSITRAQGGSGLGTTIARDLVDLMGGTIAITSEVGVGTTVTVDLSFTRAPIPARPAIANLRVALMGDVPPALAGALEQLGLGGVRHVRSFPVPETDCVFVGKNALAELPDVEDANALVIGIGSGLGAEAARSHRALLSYVENTDDSTHLRRALELVELIRSRVEHTEEAIALGDDRQILIAEDNTTNQMIARITLERAGYRCTVVDDGEKALDALSAGGYDIALIDMHMPRLDGLEVARLYNFTRLGEAERTPIVMLTADNRLEAVAEAEFAGIARFLVKPIKPSALLRIVRDVFQEAAEEADPGFVMGLVKEATLPREATPPELDFNVFGELLGFMERGEARRFFAEFREEAFGHIEALRDFDCESIGVANLQDEMHALCGAARTVGAMRLAALARRIEYAQEKEVRDRLAYWSDELEEALRAAMRLIEQRLSAAA